MKLPCLVATLATIALIALCGCQRTRTESRTTVTVDSTAIRAQPGVPEVDSVFVALGNEPFWNVRVTAREILYRDPEHQDGYRFPPASAFVEGDGLVIRTRRDIPAGEAGPRTLELRIRRGACSDGMSDTQYSMIAELRIGEETHTGCVKMEPDTGETPTRAP